MNNQKITITITITLLLALTITTYQTINLQNQIIQLQRNSDAEKIIKDYLLKNYGVSSIEELIQKKLKEYDLRYTGNPFTTALYPGQIQAENITGMHWYTWLSGTLYNRTDVLVFPEQTATFIIFGKDADNDGVYDVVYAKNTTSGQIQYGGEWDAGGVYGANASAVIQAAIDALPADGGTVFLKTGLYELTNMLKVPQKVSLIGESQKSTILKAISSMDAVITLTYGATRDRTGTIEKLNINGNDLATEGLHTNKTFGGMFRDLLITNAVEDGLYIYSSYEQYFENVISGNNGRDGFHLDATEGTMGELTFVRCHAFSNGRDGIGGLAGEGWNNIILIDVSSLHNARYGADVKGGPITWIGCLFEGNGDHQVNSWGQDIYLGCYFREAPENKAGIAVNAQTILISPRFSANAWRDVYVGSDGYVMVVNPNPQSFSYYVSSGGILVRRGYKQENSGTASGLSDGGFIAHGLAGIPTIVTLTCLNSTYDGVPVIVSWNKANTNSTHIAINIYWANGTAITDPVIAISWRAEYQP